MRVCSTIRRTAWLLQFSNWSCRTGQTLVTAFADREGQEHLPILWPEIVDRLLYLIAQSEHRMQPGYVHGRVKQWLVHLKRHFPQADKLFHEVKKITDIEQLKRHLMSLELD